MKYKITLTKDPEQIANLKERAKIRPHSYPFQKGGVAFTEETEYLCDDLTPFRSDPVHPDIDPRLVVEEIPEGSAYGSDSES
jgi:hypothetical protein